MLAEAEEGGFAYRFVTVDERGEEMTIDFNPPGYLGATNNEMEILGCIEALKQLAGVGDRLSREDEARPLGSTRATSNPLYVDSAGDPREDA